MKKRSELLEVAETQPNDMPTDEADKSKVAANRGADDTLQDE
jgi:hypothetical protein